MVTLKTPEAPATSKQLWLLHLLTKTDTRNLNLTMQEASNRINELKSNNGIRPQGDTAAVYIDQQLIAAQKRLSKHLPNRDISSADYRVSGIRPLINPHASAIKQDRQKLAQARYDKHNTVVLPEVSGRSFVGVTKETERSSAPWRVAYKKRGKEYAGHFSSKVKAIKYAKGSYKSRKAGLQPILMMAKRGGDMIRVYGEAGELIEPIKLAFATTRFRTWGQKERELRREQKRLAKKEQGNKDKIKQSAQQY